MSTSPSEASRLRAVPAAAPAGEPDPAARPVFDILIREHAAMLSTYLRAVATDGALRDEVFADTVLTAWKTLSRYDHARPFGAWLRGIARRLLLAHSSARRAVELTPEILDLLDDRFARIAMRPGDTFDDQIAFLKDCLAALAPRSREVVEATYFEGQKGPAVARRLGLSADNARKILTRARESLRDCVRRRLAREGAAGGAT